MPKPAPVPSPGDTIYVPTALYLSRGRDDVQGGKATVERIEERPEWGVQNRLWVYVKEVPGRGYNWFCLAHDQEKLAAKFGDRVAHPDPDDRPEMNTGAL